ncbi:MAG TPA: AI-2E family transporter, partial [Anseongella sp.]|nr:AI-2E family transporter [Anseongella sp.]
MNPHRSRSIELAASLLCLVLIVTILYFLQSVIVPLLFAILIAISLYPIAKRLENWRLPKLASAVISVIIAIIIIAGLIYFIVNQVIIIGHTDFNLHDKFISIV